MSDEEFDNQVEQAVQVLEQNNIEKIVINGLQLLVFMKSVSDSVVLSKYFSKLMGYFTALSKFLKNTNIPREVIQKGLEMSLSCNFLTPRLYMAYFFAIAAEDYESLEELSQMITMVGHPLRAIYLRYTYIYFYPQNFVTFQKFLTSNFTEMINFYNEIDFHDDYSNEAIISYITANISLGLYNITNRYQKAQFFLESTINQKERLLTDSIFYITITNLSGEEIEPIYNTIEKYLKNTSLSSEKLKSCYYIIQTTSIPSEVYNFLSSTEYINNCRDQLFKRALELNDEELLLKIAKRWQSENILRPLVNHLGYKKLISDDLIPKNNAEFLSWFIDSFQKYMEPKEIRQLIENYLTSRPEQLDNALLLVAKRGFEFSNLIFSKPFVFSSTEMLNLCLDGCNDRKTIEEYVNRSSSTISAKERQKIKESHGIISSNFDPQLSDSNLSLIDNVDLYMSLLLRKDPNTNQLLHSIRTIFNIAKEYPAFILTTQEKIIEWKSILETLNLENNDLLDYINKLLA